MMRPVLLTLLVSVGAPPTLGQAPAACPLAGPGKNAFVTAITSNCHCRRSGGNTHHHRRSAQECDADCSAACARALVPAFAASCLKTKLGQQLRKVYPASFAKKCAQVVLQPATWPATYTLSGTPTDHNYHDDALGDYTKTSVMCHGAPVYERPNGFRGDSKTFLYKHSNGKTGAAYWTISVLANDDASDACSPKCNADRDYLAFFDTSGASACAAAPDAAGCAKAWRECLGAGCFSFGSSGTAEYPPSQVPWGPINPTLTVVAGKPKSWKMPAQTQFVSADPGMKSRTLSTGTGAWSWGIWRKDPGPRGVTLDLPDIQALEKSGQAPAGWKFDKSEWWLEEHGLIMEIPAPLPAGRYKVSWLNWRPGAVQDVLLTVDTDGTWSLGQGAKLHDVTHLPCRAAKYTPMMGHSGGCLPEHAPRSKFPVTPGGPMPSTPNCAKLDYAVLFLSAIWA